MESVPAATLPKKKINKGKLKKTIKNVLCRPDPLFWPSLSDDQQKQVEAVLCIYKVSIPEYKKPLWKDLKSIPKEKRPKPPKIDKVEGLLFGMSECSAAIHNNQCSGVMIENSVNPRTIVQTVLEDCTNFKIPVICIEGLRKNSARNFGIPTSCLGVKKDFLPDISNIINELGKDKLPKDKPVVKHKIEDSDKANEKDLTMDTDAAPFQYVYRTSKKSRVFIPPADGIVISKGEKQFVGQDFIELPDKPKQQDKKAFMKMIVKRISNNANRPKVKAK